MENIQRYELGGVRFVIIDGDVYWRYADVFDTGEEEREDEEELPLPAVTRLTNKCGRCGEPGHKARKCPTRAPYQKPDKPVGAAAHKGPRKCSGCDEPGHTIQTCGRRSQDDRSSSPLPEPDQSSKRGALSRDDFERAKDMQADGENSMAIANEVGLPLVAVGKVMASDDYEEYLSKF